MYKLNLNLSGQKLYKLYWQEKLSINTIAKKLNCSETLIRNRLIKYNIRIRTVKEATNISNQNRGKNHWRFRNKQRGIRTTSMGN